MTWTFLYILFNREFEHESFQHVSAELLIAKRVNLPTEKTEISIRIF